MTHREDMQARILAFLEAYTQQYGYSPSYDEVAAGVGLHSKSHVYYYIDGLTKAGQISRRAGCPRTLAVTGALRGERIG